MRALPKLLGTTLVALLISSTACTRTVQVPVFVEAPGCPLEPLPDFPKTSARACGAEVCLSSEDVVAVWEWARSVRRWAELAVVCLDSRS